MEKPFIYMDNAATTKISNSCFNAMLPYIQQHYGNPSSIYSIAHVAKAAVEGARKKASAAIGALPEEIFFTSCATESDNWAIKCGAKLGLDQGKNQIITTVITRERKNKSGGKLYDKGSNHYCRDDRRSRQKGS